MARGCGSDATRLPAGLRYQGLHDRFTASPVAAAGDAGPSAHTSTAFAAPASEVLEVALHAVAVLGGDVGLTHQHQLADVFPASNNNLLMAESVTSSW